MCITRSTRTLCLVYVYLFATSQEDPVGRIHRFSLAAVLTATLLAFGIPTFATSPLTITDSVTDPTNWLSSDDRAAIEEAVNTAASRGKTIRFVYVDDFSDLDERQWCQESVSSSSLDSGTIVYAIAYSQRRDVACSDDEQVTPLLTAAIRAAQNELTSDPLTPSEAASSAGAFVRALTSPTPSSSATTSGTKRSASGATNTSSQPAYTSLFVIAGLFIAGFLTVIIGVTLSSHRSRKNAKRALKIDKEACKNAVREANRQLLAADEQIRTASDELDFARMQFGITETEEFERAIEAGKAAVSRAFDAQGPMNDATSPAVQGEMARALMRDLAQAMNPLSTIQASFASKHAEQSTLPEHISAARQRLAEQLTDLERAKVELSSIAALYPAQMLASLQDNPEQAAALLTSARASLDSAQEAATSDQARAASALDTALRALTMAGHQIEAVFSAKSDLDAIRERLVAAVNSISSDIADVEKLDTDPLIFDPLVAQARTAIGEAQAALTDNGDPLAALEHLRNAEATLDATLAPLRTEEEAYERAHAAAQTQISLAESAVDHAQRYVQGRRGAIDLPVRSMMNDAEKALNMAREALKEKDPQSASTHANNARTLANRVVSVPLQPMPPAGSWGTAQPRSGPYTGSSLGDFLLWSTLFSNSAPHDRTSPHDFDPFRHGGHSSGSGWSFASGTGANWGLPGFGGN